MRIEVTVPPLSESVSDATLGQWHKPLGSQVRRDENLVDLETDKVMLEIPAPADGVLVEIVKADREVVIPGELLAIVETEVADVDGSERLSGSAPEQSESGSASVSGAASPSRPAPGPAVRKLIAERGLPEREGSGRGGRFTKGDLITATAAQSSNLPEGETARSAHGATSSPNNPLGRPERRVAMSRIRARIAERLQEVQREAAILTTFNEIDMSAVQALRRRHQEAFSERHGIKLGLMSFFVRACVEALRRFPQLNASIDGADIVYHDYYDIGVAVSSDRGLVVPIIRDADRLSLAETERAIRDFAEAARDGQLTLEQITGGTFSITNGGVFGSLLSTPIINPPQSAILGMHKIEERPVAVAGEVVVRPMMYLALSYDHRLIDGRDAVSFLVTVKSIIEDPTLLLLEA